MNLKIALFTLICVLLAESALARKACEEKEFHGRTIQVCREVFDMDSGTFTDSRDGQTYKTVQIGGQVWMAENLNYKMENSYCYENSADSCAKYGRLYTWNAAKNACPSGWHLPSNQEWNELESFVEDDNGGEEGGFQKDSWLVGSEPIGWIGNGNSHQCLGTCQSSKKGECREGFAQGRCVCKG